MAWVLPRSTDFVLKEGDRGIVVWALQKQCERYKIKCALDGDFGAETKKAVQQLQVKIGVGADGVAGPKTQQTLARRQCNAHDGLPEDLLWSKCSYESNGYLGAVNWQVEGGVDCGVTQRRVYAADYDDDAAIERAFDSGYQVPLSARTIKSRFDQWLNDPGIRGNQELCWRTAVLNHNYPALAIRIAQFGVKGLSSYYTSPQKWVLGFGLKFPDGHAIDTPLEWGQRYALGNDSHDEPGQAVRLVKDWSA